MKFNNFVKYAAGDGMILKAKNGDSWLFYGQTGMKIPEGKNICGKEYDMPKHLHEMLYDIAMDPCELEAAFVPDKDSKPSELLRRFGRGDYAIDIPNKIFGFIEKSDRTFVSDTETEDESYKALLVTDDYEENPEIKMFYVVKE